MIYYEKGNWYIKDGGKEKSSGSGTWLFLDKNYEIKNDMIFMVGSSTIKLDYILPENIQKEKEKEKVDEKKELKKENEVKEVKEMKENKEVKDIK